MNRTILASLALALAAIACGRSSAPLETPQNSSPITPGLIFDCTADNPACELLQIQGDAPDAYANGQTSFFHGFADPTIRQDPKTGRLWMAYSYPRVHILPGRDFVPGVDIHLAHSDDGGETWIFDGQLWAFYEDIDRGRTSAPGFTSHEVINLLPRETEDGVIWYGVRLEYFIPLEGKYATRPPGSFRIKIMQAASPLELKTAPVATLGSTLTALGWGVDVNLAALSPETHKCNMWNEPALYFENGELFLVLRCLAFDSHKIPDPTESDILVYATTPEGDVKTWEWRYVGELAGYEEARELGGQGLTQVDIVRGRDGALLAIFSPDDWDESAQEFIHYGCRVVQIESMDPPLLKRDDNGKLVVRAIVNASDQQPLGPGSCSYDPVSATGILIARREKTSTGMNSFIYATKVMP